MFFGAWRTVLRNRRVFPIAVILRGFVHQISVVSMLVCPEAGSPRASPVITCNQFVYMTHICIYILCMYIDVNHHRNSRCQIKNMDNPWIHSEAWIISCWPTRNTWHVRGCGCLLDRRVMKLTCFKDRVLSSSLLRFEPRNMEKLSNLFGQAGSCCQKI